MKTDIFSPPPPLTFGAGEDAFSLRLKRFTGPDRMAVLTACCEMRFGEIQEALERLVVGWEGVCDANGTPIPFEQKGEDGMVRKNLGAFMGAISLKMQAQVMAGILAFLGFPGDRVQAIVEALDDGDADGVQVDPTSPPAKPMPATASGGSSP